MVSRTPRQPFFLGDLPHAWVASDFVRSALDMFAYMRESGNQGTGDALVIAAGIPAGWLDGQGVAVEGLRTPYGELGYTLQRDGQQVRLRLSPGLRVPSGGVVLQLPAALTGGTATIDGVPAQWSEAGELRVDRVPAEVVIAR